MNISSFYIHVPFCRRLCNYCDFFKYQLGGLHTPSWSDFEQQFLNHWKELKNWEEQNKWEIKKTPLETIYLGGGTPSLWGERGILFLENFFSENKFKTSLAQWTLEVDPGTCNREELLKWHHLGVNRFSVGLQTLSEAYLEIADREHNYKESKELLEVLASEKLSFSADFLLGLPRLSQKRDIEGELREILEYKPDHLSLYIMTVNESYPHFSKLPREREIEKEYLLVADILKSEGFDHYEVSNFAKPDYESRHNFVYWKGKSYWGIGPSATGQWRVTGEEMERYKWGRHLKRKSEFLKKEELELEALYLALRTKLGFAESQVPQGLRDYWLEKGFIREAGEKYRVTSRGFLLVDSMIEQIFQGVSS